MPAVVAPAPPAPAATPARKTGRRKAARAKPPLPPPAPVAAIEITEEPVDDTANAVLAVLGAAASEVAVPAATPAPAIGSGWAHSAVVLVEGDQRRIVWQPGTDCPDALRQAAQHRALAGGELAPEDDGALPTLLRLASEAGHTLQVDEAVWAHLAAHRDARHRLGTLEVAYTDGPASAALQQLLRVPLPLYQAEGALFAVVAGRALIADERGLGKGVQAIAAAQLWRRHFGVQRVLVLCAPAQRVAWQRAWRRFAGDAGSGGVQVIDGGLHQRQSMWSEVADVRILSPEALASDAAHLTRWAPDLIIVDEPQQLALRDADWDLLAAPYALVLCGAALAEQSTLMDAIVAWLDVQRLGPLAALRELHAASREGRALDDNDLERLTASLSRLMLQRLRADVADQLPPLVHSERLLPLSPGQREWHDQQAAVVRRVLAGWQASGYCSDSDQWRLAQALREMQRACHRAEPADTGSALAEATVQALAAQLEEWAATGAQRVALRCDSDADRAQLAQRLADWLADGSSDVDQDPDDGAALQLVLAGPGEALPAGLDAVLQVGVPWRPRRQPAGGRGDAPAGQQWLYLVAQDSIEGGLFDTLAQRAEVPRGLGDEGTRDYLHGDRLQAWLAAVQAALRASPSLADAAG
jgi:hypothetical protein